MTPTERNNAVVARHLEALANSAKDYTLAVFANSSSGGGTSGGSAGNVGVLDTVPSTVDGGLWYEMIGDAPYLKLRKGNYEYRFPYDRLKFVGDVSDALAAYLPFTNSTTADASGNEWATYGNPAIQDGKLYVNGSCIYNTTIADSIGSLPWTVDFWATVAGNGGSDYAMFFGMYNANYGTSGIGKDYWISAGWNGDHSTISILLCNDDTDINPTTLTPVVSWNARHHYAMTYDGSFLRYFIDGVLVWSKEHDVTLGGQFVIGGEAGISRFSNAYIDHFRVFKGAAVWTSDFTPPTESDYV